MYRLLAVSQSLFAAYCLLAASVTQAVTLSSRIVDTNDFADAVKAADVYSQHVGPENVLLVVDIDNTLLAMNSSLGSDQWFEWQEYLLKDKPESEMLVAADFKGLLRVQGVLFSLGDMRLTDTRIPGLIGGLQAAGVRTLVLTSRGPAFRSATERELRRNNLRFQESALPVNEMPLADFKPYQLADLHASGLTEEEASAFRLESPRDSSYANGVLMVAGQHKGAMLLTLLHKSSHAVRAVVFIDDHGKHVARVYDALVRRGVAVTAMHYRREDSNVRRFRYGDKSKVTKQWRKLNRAMREVFVESGAGAESTKCGGGSP